MHIETLIGSCNEWIIQYHTMGYFRTEYSPRRASHNRWMLLCYHIQYYLQSAVTFVAPFPPPRLFLNVYYIYINKKEKTALFALCISWLIHIRIFTCIFPLVPLVSPPIDELHTVNTVRQEYAYLFIPRVRKMEVERYEGLLIPRVVPSNLTSGTPSC